MWLMLFGLPLFYLGYVNQKNIEKTLLNCLFAVGITGLYWLISGYSISFLGELSLFNLTENKQLVSLTFMVVQMIFCQYAVLMLIGSVVERINLTYLMGFLLVWLLVVYAPVCFVVWGAKSELTPIKITDFAGAIVVHLTAGVGSFVLCREFPSEKVNRKRNTRQIICIYIGTIFISFGWFGFNTSPLGEFNLEVVEIGIKTLLFMISGAVGMSIYEWHREKKLTVTTICNGIISGLVTSTCFINSLGYVPSFLLGIAGGYFCGLAVTLVQKKWTGFDDPADAFAINTTGALIGSIGGSLLLGNLTIVIHQGLGTVLVLLWSCFMTKIICKMLAPFKNLKVANK